MKTKTKNKAILEALVSKGKLTTKSCMQLCGTHKLSNRISEMESKYGFLVMRDTTHSKSRFGGIDRYLEYSVSKEQKVFLRKIIAKIK